MTTITPPPLPRKKAPRRARAIGLIILVGLGVVWLFFAAGGGVSRQRQWNAQAEDVGRMIFTPDGRTLFAAGSDSARAWDPATGASKYKLTTYDSAPIRMSIDGAGGILVCARYRRAFKLTEQKIETWNLATQTLIASMVHDAHCIAISPDGKTIATARNTNAAGAPSQVELWAAPSLAAIASFPLRTTMTSGLCFSPDGKLLALGEPPAVQLLDARTGALVKTLSSRTPGFARTMQFSPDGKTLSAVVSFVGASKNHEELCVWDTKTAELKRQLAFDHSVRDASFSADGRRLAVLMYWMGFSRNDRAEVWDVARGRKLGKVTVRSPWMSSIALSPDGRQMAIGFQRPGLNKPAPIGVWRVK